MRRASVSCSRSGGERSSSSASRAGRSCSGRRGPTTTAVTCGCASSQANASVAGVVPRSAACRLERLERVEDAVVLEVEVRLRPERHPRARRRLLAAPVLAGEPAAGERAERREAEPFARAHLEHALLDVAVEQRVGVLRPVRPAVAQSLLEPGDVDVAAAVGADLPLGDESVERADRLGDRHVRIHRVGEVERDRLDAEALEAAVELAPDPLAATGRGRRRRSSG